MSKESPERKPRVGISIGDVNGVGPEVVLKTFTEPMILELFTPVIYGSVKTLSFYRKLSENDQLNLHAIKHADQATDKKINVVNCWQEEIKIEPGVSNETGAKYAVNALEKATDDLIEGKIQCLVTAPIDKSNLASQEFSFPGHTEYLAQRDKRDALMIMVHGGLRVALATGHVAVKDIAGSLTVEGLVKKLQVLQKTLKQDFNIRRPKIAVLALNPHAGDGGKFGDEETEIIEPAIKRAVGNDMLVTGPFPADGFFASGNYKHYDAILAMYHDQGLIPFKTLSEIHGVNYTAGLSFIRTSPDHGAAFDIAGKNKATPNALREAIYLACDIYKTRHNNREYGKNPLRPLSREVDSKGDEDVKEDA